MELSIDNRCKSHLAGCSHLPQLNAALLVCSLVAAASSVHIPPRRVQPAGSCPEAAAQPQLPVGEPRVLHVLSCEPLPIDLSSKIVATPVQQGVMRNAIPIPKFNTKCLRHSCNCHILAQYGLHARAVIKYGSIQSVSDIRASDSTHVNSHIA